MGAPFPDVFGTGYKREPTFWSLRSAPESAADQSTSFAGTNPVWLYTLAWGPVSTAIASQMLHAFNRMGGEVNGIDFFEWPKMQYDSVFVASGDGSSRAWDLPCISADAGSVVLRVNGSVVAFTFSAGIGVNGRDHVALSGGVTTPALGADIRADFYARRARTVRVSDQKGFQLVARPKSTPVTWNVSAALIETVAGDLL